MKLRFILPLIICFAFPAIASIIPGFQGEYYTEFSYTPESDWEAGHRLMLYHQMNAGQFGEILVNLGGWLPSATRLEDYTSKQDKPIDLSLKRLSVAINTELYKGGSPFNVTLGNINVNYSPLLAKMDEWDIWRIPSIDRTEEDIVSWNTPRNGIAFEGLQFNKMENRGFLIWESSPQDYAFGYQSTLKLSDKSVKYTRTTLFRENYGGERILLDSAQGLSLELPFKGLLLQGELDFHQQGQQLPSKAILGGILFKYGSDAEGRIDLWEIEDNFDPHYRDRTPKFDPLTQEPLPWNIIDKKGGKRGYTLALTSKTDLLQSEMEYDVFREISSGLLGKGFRNSTNVDFWGYNIAVLYERGLAESHKNEFDQQNSSNWGQFKYCIKRPVVGKNLKIIYGWEFSEVNGIGTIYNKDKGFFFKTSLLAGSFAGFEALLRLGERGYATLNRYFTVGFDYTLVGGIKLMGRLTRPGNPSPHLLGGRYYDRTGQLKEADNIFLISYKISL